MDHESYNEICNTEQEIIYKYIEKGSITTDHEKYKNYQRSLRIIKRLSKIEYYQTMENNKLHVRKN